MPIRSAIRDLLQAQCVLGLPVRDPRYLNGLPEAVLTMATSPSIKRWFGYDEATRRAAIALVSREQGRE